MNQSAPVPASRFEFDALRLAVNYRQALVREFSPFLRGKIIEIGAGIGQMTTLLSQLPEVEEILAIEPEAAFCNEFPDNLRRTRLIRGTVENLPAGLSANAIVSVNVLEHIKDDARELDRYARILGKNSGVLCLFVPARMEIFSELDRDFGHFRRYHLNELRVKLRQAGFDVVRIHYFNLVGYFGWWFNFCLMKRRSFAPSQIKVFDRLVFPVTGWLESKVCWPPIGQSLLAVGRAGV